MSLLGRAVRLPVEHRRGNDCLPMSKGRVRGMGTGALRVLSAAGRFQMVSESLNQGINLHETSLARKAKASTCAPALACKLRRVCDGDLLDSELQEHRHGEGVPADDPLQLAASRVAAPSSDVADAEPARMGFSPSAAAAAAPASAVAGFEFEYGLADAKDDAHGAQGGGEGEAEAAAESRTQAEPAGQGISAAAASGLAVMQPSSSSAPSASGLAMMQPSALYQYLGLRPDDGDYHHQHHHRHDDGSSLNGEASRWDNGVGLDIDALALDASGSLRTASVCSFDHDAAAAELLGSAARLSPAAARRAAAEAAASSRSKRGASSWARSGPRFASSASKADGVGSTSEATKLSQTDALRQRLAGAAFAAQARSLQAAQALSSSGVAYRVVEAFGHVRVARVNLASPSRASRSPTMRRPSAAAAERDFNADDADAEANGGDDDDPLRASQIMATSAAAPAATALSSRGRRLHAAHAPLLPGFASPLVAAPVSAPDTRALAGRCASAAVASDPRVGAGGASAGFARAQQTPRAQLGHFESGSAGDSAAHVTAAGSPWSPASQLPVRALWAAATPGSSSGSSVWAGDVTGIRDAPLHDGGMASAAQGPMPMHMHGNAHGHAHAHGHAYAHAHAYELPLWEESLTEADLCSDDEDNEGVGDAEEGDDGEGRDYPDGNEVAEDHYEEQDEEDPEGALSAAAPEGFRHDGHDAHHDDHRDGWHDQPSSVHGSSSSVRERQSPTRAIAAAALQSQSQSPFPRFGVPRNTRMHLARRSGAADPVRRFAATQRARARQAVVGSAHRAGVAAAAGAANSLRSGRSLSPRSAQVQAHAWAASSASVRSPLAAEHWGWASNDQRNDDIDYDDTAECGSATGSDSHHRIAVTAAAAAAPGRFARVDSTVALANSQLDAVAAAAALEWEQGLGVMRLLAAQALEADNEGTQSALPLPAWAATELALGSGDGIASGGHSNSARADEASDSDGGDHATDELGLLLLESEVCAGADDAFSPDHASVKLLHSAGSACASPRGYSCAGSPTAAAEAAGCCIFELQAFSPLDAGAAAGSFTQSSRTRALEPPTDEISAVASPAAAADRCAAPSRSRFRELRAGLRVADAWLLQEPASHASAAADVLRRCEPAAPTAASDRIVLPPAAAAATVAVPAAARGGETHHDDSVDADVSAACAVLDGADSIDVEALRPASLSAALHLHDDACAAVEAMLQGGCGPAPGSDENDYGYGHDDDSHAGSDDNDDDDACSLRQTRSVYQPSSPSAVETEAY